MVKRNVQLISAHERWEENHRRRMAGAKPIPDPIFPPARNLTEEEIAKQLAWIEKHNPIRKLDLLLETNSQYVLEAFNTLVRNEVKAIT